ncbi:hypothetical protein Catovirus_1_385 [Catovirus CTV1]|uniref:Uncharacterized protein n=1 Tax=Catovirus CTV1 TaxID=1977631 RepID=A0A1V0S9E2_9VIRU|nr:hypothetical protein Catovirus_1_385 [Catovirus CTV1]
MGRLNNNDLGRLLDNILKKAVKYIDYGFDVTWITFLVGI